MASWNFRKRIRLIPGVRINLSSGGISTSVGVRGANVTLGKKGAYLNMGIPGTGIYKREKLSSNTEEVNRVLVIPESESVPETEDNIFSAEPAEITSQDMKGVKESIITAHKQRIQLQLDIEQVKKTLLFSKFKLILCYLLIFGFVAKNLTKELKDNLQKQKNAIVELGKQRDVSCVKLYVDFDEDVRQKYKYLVESFKSLITSELIWDVTRAEEQNRAETRSAASVAILKTDVKFDFKGLLDIKYESEALYFQNHNGADLYFYPNFVVMQGEGNFGIIGLDELEFSFNDTSFIEEGSIPSDTKTIDTTWFKVNKNGAPDKRFKDNYEIPVVRYGTITLKTTTGVNEEYQFSNYEASEKFSEDFLSYQNVIKKAVAM